ncbi:MAG: hypothetical protein K8T90_22450 [Planctomycetes bacterium]|nr:hypothetical protein [Planctomycetota bacterium]
MRFQFRVVVSALALALSVLFAGPVRSEAGAGTLSDDGRVGAVTDLQGTAFVRPSGRTRWSPVAQRTVLMPGDELRTMPRGAHAAEVRLADGGSLVLGPGALARLESRGRLRITAGDAEVAGAEGHPIAVSGPGGFETSVTKATVVRVDPDAPGAASGAKPGTTTILAAAPRWLTGYRASTTDEWMGSLLAKVDGRDVPLYVGYHKVSVTIRDQIAETTVEESFVNTTGATLEGVFSFPLPAGASISGFGMWVGEELVEADLIERERARAIYEDILARKKDPGLLEWSGGNLFKASVFPIFPHGEKRIRVRYTQVLPLEGAQVRYRYALRSELLRTHPLRELRIHVAVQSATPIVSATSPTHEVRVTQTAHEATLDYSASDVTPDRDFEIALGLESTTALRAVAHRRDDDGYFALLLAPPDAASGGWKRDLVPEGTPLDVTFVADTSGSMSSVDRATQRRFIESALAMMGADDTFRLLTCDRSAVRLADDALPATEANVARALAFLDARRSLGWTDIDNALAAAVERATPKTVVIYVGDGIGTTGDADPVALAQRIGRMAFPAGASVHAISTGASYEQGVMEAMAARGGSFRAAGDDPARTAYALFSEIAQPAVRDLKVAFEGIRTARVYPERLPNLAAGTQQIVLGRFLPEGEAAQSGRVTVTGTLDGKPVRYDADLTVAPGAEGTGNSFLPRLWARRHLDALLAEGRTPAIKDEIVAMSQSYGIITPYTSFLVLENDEDRERYGVGRRVAMRDGERFFTDARTAANTAALRDQMQKARSWRLGLRRSMLAEISGLGRGLAISTSSGDRRFDGDRLFEGPGTNATIGIGGGSGRAVGAKAGSDGYRGPRGEVPPDSREASDPAAPPGGDWDAEGGMPSELADHNESDGDLGGPATPGSDVDGFSENAKSPKLEERLKSAEMSESSLADRSFDENAPAGPSGPMKGGGGGPPPAGHRSLASGKPVGGSRPASAAYFNGAPWLRQQLLQRFPGLALPPKSPPDPQPEPTWDPESIALLKSAAEPVALPAGTDARVEITWQDGAVGADDDTFWPMQTGRALVAPDRWFTTTRSAGAEPYDQWCAQDRGVLGVGTRLGRRRAAAESDRATWSQIVGRQGTDFLHGYVKSWTARIVSREGALVVVELKSPGDTDQRFVLTIDIEKRVIVGERALDRGMVSHVRRRGGFVLAGGLWFATEESLSDAQDKVTWRRALSVRSVAAAEFDAALAAGLSGQTDAIFLGVEEPSLAAAKQSVHDGHGTFADHFVITVDHAAFSRWDDAWASWAKARALVDLPDARRPGADWIEATLLSMSRRGEQFAAHLRTLAERVVKSGGPAAHGLARQVFQLASNAMSPDERLTLIDRLEQACDGASSRGELAWQRVHWQQQRANTLSNAGRHPEAIAIWRTLWDAQPGNVQRLMALMNALTNAGDVDGATEVFRMVDQGALKSQPGFLSMFLSQYVRLLGNAARYDEVIVATDRWILAAPEDSSPYSAQLAALIALDRIDAFDAWIAARVEAKDLPGKDAVATAQLTAAIDQALGQNVGAYWNARWWGDEFDVKWARPLAVLARRLARDPAGNVNLASRIVQNYRWQRTDEHHRLIEELRGDLAAPGGIESPKALDLVRLLSWHTWNRSSVDAKVWRDVTDRVKARWRAATDATERAELRRWTLQLLDSHLEPLEAADVLREDMKSADAVAVPGIANDLLGRLVRVPWTQAMEDEAFALVPRLVGPKATDAEQRARFLTAVRWLTSRIVAIRAESLLPPQVEREKLPRADLRSRQAAVRTDARKAFAARLAVEAKTAPATMRPWLEIERLGLLAELGTEPATVEAETRELLLSAPPTTGLSTTDDTGDVTLGDEATVILRERCVLTLSYLAVRRDAPEGLADRVVALFRDRLEKEPSTLDWRYAIFRLLVALDRVPELEAALRSWIEPAKVDSRWRTALGYVLAETGRMRDAAEQFEEVARLDELDAPGYATLADWYLVLDEKARRESALDRRLAQVDENTLNMWIQNERWRVQSRGREGVPPTMDDEVLRQVRVLLSKSSHPQNVLYSVTGLYQATKDFRILAAFGDGVVGHTPEGIYGFLEAAGGTIEQVHEEATCDEMRLRIEERRVSAKTDTDRRGLALLLVRVESRAAEVLDQRGPHAARALADLRAARLGTWLPGERRLMADFLASLGKLPDAALAAEQVDQLKELHRVETRGSVDRLRIGAALARTQWGYGRHDDAIDGLVAALDEYRQATGGVLPPQTVDLADVLADWHEAIGRYAAGETWLAAETARQVSVVQRQWYERRIFQLWANCLAGDGTVSLGSKADLYRAARDRMERAFFVHAPDQLDDLLRIVCTLHSTAHKHVRIPGVGDDLLRFARGALVEAMPRVGQQATNLVQVVSETIHEIAGPLPALTYMVERIEAEPTWRARRGRQGGWASYGYRMAEWRREQPAIGDIEPRLLAIVLRELERDLSTVQGNWRHMYGSKNSREFWREKAGDFADVARKVIAASPEAPSVLLHVASYQWGGLGLNDEAIRTLEDADLRKALREDGRYRLVQWHQEMKHWKESLPHAERLVAERPDVLDYRVRLIRALHGVDRDADGKALVDATRAHFADLVARKLSRNGVAAALAKVCVECGYHERAAVILPEAISERRLATRGGRGDSELSRLYGLLAQTFTGLGRHDEAVDAASSAVVIWGFSDDNRQGSLMGLRDAIAGVPDLAAWTAKWEADVAATGLDAPVIRLALAEVHMKRKEPDAALRHLVVARRHTPDDPTVHAQIVRAAEMKKDAAGVADALAASIEALPKQPDLYPRLAKVLTDLGRADDAERALTGLAEYAPNEADGHRRLADVYTNAKRHAEAVVQLRQVVRIRSTEPAGWLDLARSLAKSGQKVEAREVLDSVLRAPWGTGQTNAVDNVRREIE